MKKLFGSFNLSWKFLILFSIGIGLLVGILNRLPFLIGTSFQDIAIYIEMWIILAIFVIVNCKSFKDAVCKCFIFFLISQPLIYIVEVLIDTVFYKKDFIDNLVLYFKNYYFGGNWFYWTLLTIPGSFIAYQVKKDNILSSLILSVATGVLAFIGVKGLLNTLINNFPYHLLNSLLCLYFSYRLIFLILKNKRNKIISIILTTFGLLIGIIMFVIDNNSIKYSSIEVDFDKDINIVDVYADDNTLVYVSFESGDDFMFIHSLDKIGNTKIVATDNYGNQYIYDVSVLKDNIVISKE